MAALKPQAVKEPEDWRSLVIPPDLPFLETIRKIESGAQQIALVADARRQTRRHGLRRRRAPGHPGRDRP